MTIPEVRRQFEAFEAKLDRARHHLTDLHDEIEVFRRARGYDVTREAQPDGRTEVFRFHVESSPPTTLSTIAGDFLHNARSALNCLAFALHIRESGVPTPKEARQIEFPLVIDMNDWAAIAQRRIWGISPKARAVIDGLQPYNAGNKPFRRLYDLSNVDKHRSINFLYWQFSSLTWWGDDPSGRWLDGFLGPLEDGAEVARFLWTDKPNQDVKFGFTCDVAFGEGPGDGFPAYIAANQIFVALLNARDKLLPMLW